MDAFNYMQCILTIFQNYYSFSSTVYASITLYKKVQRSQLIGELAPIFNYRGPTSSTSAHAADP